MYLKVKTNKKPTQEKQHEQRKRLSTFDSPPSRDATRLETLSPRLETRRVSRRGEASGDAPPRPQTAAVQSSREPRL